VIEHSDETNVTGHGSVFLDLDVDNGFMVANMINAAKAFDDACRARGSGAWFRGHRYAEWLLESTLHRHAKDVAVEAPALGSPEHIRELLRLSAKGLHENSTTTIAPSDAGGAKSFFGSSSAPTPITTS
jgi:hypothetical protein